MHLLAEHPPKVCVSALVNSLQGISARPLRPELTRRANQHTKHGHLWSPPYFAASSGGAPLSIIRQQIEQQRRPLNEDPG